MTGDRRVWRKVEGRVSAEDASEFLGHGWEVEDALLLACRAVCEAEDRAAIASRVPDRAAIAYTRRALADATARRDHAQRAWYAYALDA